MKLPLLSHLDELRKRIINILVFFIVFFIASFIFSNTIILFIQNSILKSIKLIVLTPYEFIISKLSLSLYLSILLTLPILIYHLVSFIKPALSKKERRLLIPATVTSFILLFIGAGFGYFILLKIGIIYLSKLSIVANVANAWSFGKVINFIFLSILITGLIFQLPLFISLLNKLNIINKEMIKQKRLIIYVLIFILAAILTPPDPITQLLIAGPLIVLFEISFVFIKIFP